VHFDKFAASHQKLREQEAETYGQRQLQDPASVELLKETYLPQQTTSYNQFINGLLKPTAYTDQYNNPTTSAYSPSQSSMGYYGYNTTPYTMPMSNAANTPFTTQPQGNNFGMYQQPYDNRG
jgi:hypothetical protein